MKKVLTILLLFMFFGCSQKSVDSSTPQTNLQSSSPIQTTKVIKEKPLEKLKNPSGQIKMPKVKQFDIQDLRRNSNQTDESGWNVPPFDDAEVGLDLYQEPKVGEKVTIVPLKVNIEPFQLSIIKFEKHENDGCDNTMIKRDFFWNIDLEKIINKEILDIKPVKGNNQELPFEVFTIYPAVEFAKNIPSEKLSQQMVPKGITISTIEAAIDLNNDNTPDLIYVEYCCGDKTKRADNCDYNCIEWYKKINGVWKLVDDANPC